MKYHLESILKNAAGETTLSETERARLRETLRAYTIQRPVVSPSHESGVLAQFRALVANRPLALALSAFLVVAVSGTGAAQAAEGALPGDALYGLKVGIVEPLRLSLASTETKHSLERTFAERRLTEAATLANLDRLSPDAEATLAAQFTYYSRRALISEDRASSTPPTDAIVEGFSARISAYDAVLARLETNRGGTTKALRSAIRDAASAAASSTGARQDSAIDIAAAASLQTAAEDALGRSTEVITSLEATIPTSTRAQAARVLEDAEEFRTRGKQFLVEQDTKAAAQAFKASLRASHRASVLTHAAANYNVDAFDESIDATSTPNDTFE